MFKELFAKDANNKFLLNQDGTCRHASIIVLAYVVTTFLISDMSAQTAALQFSTDLQTSTLLDQSAVVDSAHVRVVVTQLESFKEVAGTVKFQKVSCHSGSNVQSLKAVMTSGVTADDTIFFKFKIFKIPDYSILILFLNLRLNKLL